MPLSALALVLLAAVPHASWDIAAKRAGAGQRVTLNTSLLTSLLWLPAGLRFGWHEAPRWGGLLAWSVVNANLPVLRCASAPVRRCADAPAVLQSRAAYPPRRGDEPGMNMEMVSA